MVIYYYSIEEIFAQDFLSIRGINVLLAWFGCGQKASAVGCECVWIITRQAFIVRH